MLKIPIRRGSVAIALICALVLVVSACSSPGSSENGKDQKNGKQTIQLAYNPTSFKRFYAAQKFGLFEKHGLDIKLNRFPNAIAATTAYKSGSIDIGYTGIPGFMANLAAKTSVQLFLLEDEAGTTQSLVVPNESSIKSISDLAGKKVGTSVGSTGWVALMDSLNKSGVDLSSVKIVDIPPAAWVPAFKNNSVDALFIWAPVLYQIEEMGGRVIDQGADYSPAPVGWMVREGFLKDDPDAVQRFIAAMDEATGYLKTNRNDVIEYMAEQMGAPLSAVEKTYDKVSMYSIADSIDPANPYSLAHPDQFVKSTNDVKELFQEYKIVDTKGLDLAEGINPKAVEAYLKAKGRS